MTEISAEILTDSKSGWCILGHIFLSKGTSQIRNAYQQKASDKKPTCITNTKHQRSIAMPGPVHYGYFTANIQPFVARSVHCNKLCSDLSWEVPHKHNIVPCVIRRTGVEVGERIGTSTFTIFDEHVVVVVVLDLHLHIVQHVMATWSNIWFLQERWTFVRGFFNLMFFEFSLYFKESLNFDFLTGNIQRNTRAMQNLSWRIWFEGYPMQYELSLV